VAFQDPTCDVGAAVIPTTTTGLTYAIAGNVAPGEHVKVTATANDGYTIKGSNTWEHTFGLVPSNCVVQETTTEPTPTQPLTPPTRPTKPAEKTAKQPPEKTAPAKAPAKATPKPPKPAPLTPPTKAVAGAQKTAGAEPELAYTP
jgi:hypothetical protein